MGMLSTVGCKAGLHALSARSNKSAWIPARTKTICSASPVPLRRYQPLHADGFVEAGRQRRRIR